MQQHVNNIISNMHNIVNLQQ